MGPFFQVVWDDPDDTLGNVQHVAENGLTIDEVEFVLANPTAQDVSHSSGRPCRFGYTPSGEHIIVVYEQIAEDVIYPVTAYYVPEP